MLVAVAMRFDLRPCVVKWHFPQILNNIKLYIETETCAIVISSNKCRFYFLTKTVFI